MRHLFKLILFLVLSAAILLGIVWWVGKQPLKLRNSPLDFRITAGSSLRSAASQMREAGIDVRPRLLSAMARLSGADAVIKAGSYSVEQGVTSWQLLDMLVAGRVSQGSITLLEGETFRQWRQRIDADPLLHHDTSGLSEPQIAARLGLAPPGLEGWLFPDTYFFDKHSSDLELLARAAREMRRRLDIEWARRAPGLPYRSPDEALIMASIIEKETGLDADRRSVAAVFVNRLRKGMLLQTDPTVIYGLGEHFDGNLRKRDLQTDTPYNTYLHAGLPPTPIAMPSLASLRAALNPADSDVLYFVARGDGSSEFSRTLDQHNEAVNRYQRGVK